MRMSDDPAGPGAAADLANGLQRHALELSVQQGRDDQARPYAERTHADRRQPGRLPQRELAAAEVGAR